MTGPSAALVVRAEIAKLFSRMSARVGLLVSLGLGALMPLMLLTLVHSGMSVNEIPADQYFDATATRPLVWALHLRNFIVIRAFLVVLGAQSTAGELASHTLREDLLRPVPRSTVLIAKWLAVLAWDAASLAVMALAAGVPSLLLFGASGPWVGVGLALLVNLLCDAGVVALVLAIAVLTRSVVATVAGVIVALVLERFVGWGMAGASMMAGLVGAPAWAVTLLEQHPLLPSAAFSVWTFTLPDVERTWQSAGSLAVITAACLAVALLRFRRMDVP